jgi:hypothetical protein
MRVLVTFLTLFVLAGCASTQFKVYEAVNNSYQGTGGSKSIVEGMEVWETGTPPRKYKVLGIIDDQRPNALIPMSMMGKDVVQKARGAGGDALILLDNQNPIVGYSSTGTAQATSYGNTAYANSQGYTSAVRHSISKFAVIKYMD